MKKYIQPVLFILLCEAAGIIGSIFTTSEIPTWYTTQIKPSFAPPNSVFGPVWTTLFALMGIGMYLVYRKGWDREDVRFALKFFAVHLLINISWSVVFFTLHSPGWALVVIALMWAMIAYSIYLFGRISNWAGWLLVPYLLWVSFASVLNFAIWNLNN